MSTTDVEAIVPLESALTMQPPTGGRGDLTPPPGVSEQAEAEMVSPPLSTVFVAGGSGFVGSEICKQVSQGGIRGGGLLGYCTLGGGRGDEYVFFMVVVASRILRKMENHWGGFLYCLTLPLSAPVWMQQRCVKTLLLPRFMNASRPYLAGTQEMRSHEKSKDTYEYVVYSAGQSHSD